MLRLASIWSNPRKRRRFDMVVFAVMAVILGITVATALFMGSIGIPIMSFMYGVNFERFRNLALLMIAAGGITAAIDFLYAIITVLRRQDDVMKLYLIAFAASVVAPLILVGYAWALMGAVLSYLLVMLLLLVLLVLEYINIRRAITRERNLLIRSESPGKAVCCEKPPLGRGPIRKRARHRYYRTMMLPPAAAPHNP